MALNKVVAFLVAILLVALLVFGIRWLAKPRPIAYSNAPADWIDGIPGGASVNVREATFGKGEYNGVNEQLLIGTELNAFAYEGLYKGSFFDTVAFGNDGKTVMEFTPKLYPNDGIIQGFMVERVNNGVLETHIFIDEDFRKALKGDVRIVWGADYAQSRPFAFQQLKPGIYHDVVQDDASRLQPEISVGGVQVGNMLPGGVDPAKADDVIMMAIH